MPPLIAFSFVPVYVAHVIHTTQLYSRSQPFSAKFLKLFYIPARCLIFSSSVDSWLLSKDDTSAAAFRATSLRIF